MFKFEQPGNIESESKIDFNNTKQELQLNIHDLYSQRLLKKDEALVLLDKINGAQSINDLHQIDDEFIHNDSFFVSQEGELVDELITIDNFQKIYDKAIGEVNVENWKELYKDLLDTVNNSYDQKYHETLIKGWLAKFLETVYSLYNQNDIGVQSFADELKGIMSEVESNLPDFLTSTQGEELGKRKPSFIESVDATIERYNKIEELKNVFSDVADSIIIGGSMSYGPFFNVRKSLDSTGSSDIDAIITLSEDKLDAQFLEKLRASDIFDDSEKEVFFERIDKFKKLYENDEADIFSQKFHATNTDFDISIHFFTPKQFDRLIGDGFKNDLKTNEDKTPVLRDFKAKEFPYEVCEPQNFNGEKYIYKIPPQKKVDGGVMTELPLYTINNKHLYPGVYQNLVSPMFSLTYDKSGQDTEKVEDFYKDMEERMKEEWGDNPEANMLKSHIRNKIFSPILFKS